MNLANNQKALSSNKLHPKDTKKTSFILDVIIDFYLIRYMDYSLQNLSRNE